MQHAERFQLTLLFAILVLTACGDGDKKGSEEDESSTQYVEMGDDYGLTTEIRGDRSLTRTWVKPSVEKIASLSEGEAYTLFNPRLASAVSKEGHLFVYDFGDYAVKAFTREGEYVATYGRGEGRGPGEMTMMSDVGVWRDSLVYVVDPKQRRVSFFEKNGDFVRAERYEVPLARLAWGDDSTKYVIISHASPTFLRIILSSGRQTVISQLFSGEAHPIMQGGTLHTSRDGALYVPLHFPVLLTFSPGDTTGTAYPTPDYGQPRPKADVEERGRVVSVPSTRIHEKSTLHDGVLSVEIPDSESDSLRFDLYDAREMEYLHSIQLPVEGSSRPFRALYVHGMDLVATVQKATVNIYEVQYPEQ